jgi:hypothetical protein
MKLSKFSGAATLLALCSTLVTPSASRADARSEMLTWIKDAEEKMVSLAEATPEEKYAYRPTTEVRSAGEVFMHAAGANFGMPSFTGVKPPEGFKFETYEKSLTKKADIVAALKSSYAHAEKALADLPEADMNAPVDLFGMKSTKIGVYTLLLAHNHEHLGQSIAYARMNGIVPPWTAKQQAAMKEMHEKEAAAKAAAAGKTADKK